MWGDFTSAASKLVMRAHTCAVAPSGHVCCCVWCSYLMTSLNLLRCSPLLLPAAPVKIPSNQDGCSSAESWNRLGHARVLTFQLSAAVLEVICCYSLSNTKEQNQSNVHILHFRFFFLLFTHLCIESVRLQFAFLFYSRHACTI